MEQVINNLLGRYERGALSRRDLVGALAVVALTNQSASAAGFESSTLNHVSITVSNLQRSVEFLSQCLRPAGSEREQGRRTRSTETRPESSVDPARRWSQGRGPFCHRAGPLQQGFRDRRSEGTRRCSTRGSRCGPARGRPGRVERPADRDDRLSPPFKRTAMGRAGYGASLPCADAAMPRISRMQGMIPAATMASDGAAAQDSLSSEA